MSPQPIEAALVTGITGDDGACRLLIPLECKWGTVWCRIGSQWVGQPWHTGTHELRFLAPPTCEITGSLFVRDGSTVSLPKSAMLLSQDPNTGTLHAGRIDADGTFSCRVAASAPAILRLIDAGPWDFPSPLPLVSCGAGVRLAIERMEHVAIEDPRGTAVAAAEIFVLERSSHGVLSRRSSLATDGVHRVVHPGTRAELAAHPSLVLIRAAGFPSATRARPLDGTACTLARGGDPRLWIVGQAGDSLRIDIGGDGAPVSPLSCLVDDRLPASGRLECELPAGVLLRVVLARNGSTVLHRVVALTQDTTISAEDGTTGRLVVHAEDDWAADVIAEAGPVARNGDKTAAGRWLFHDLAPGSYIVTAAPQAQERDWRSELGIRCGVACEVHAGAATTIALPRPAAPARLLVVKDATGRPLPDVTIRDRERVARTTGPDGGIPHWQDWKPPLALAGTEPGVWLPLPVHEELVGSSSVVVATVETRWLHALAPLHVSVRDGDAEREWKSITFTSSDRTGRLVAFAASSAPQLAAWPFDVDGRLNVEIALRNGGVVRAESVTAAEQHRYELRLSGSEHRASHTLRLLVEPRSPGAFETVDVVIFDASSQPLRAYSTDCLAVRTGSWHETTTGSGPKRIAARARSNGAATEWVGNVDRDLLEVRLDW